MLQNSVLICNRAIVPRYFAASAGNRISAALHLKFQSHLSSSPVSHRVFSTSTVSNSLSTSNHGNMAADQQNAKITLYWLDKSRSHRVLWLLEELKLDYELKVFKRTKDKLAPPELKEVHPLGKSPVVGIQAPGAEKQIMLAESGAITEYLTEYFGKWLIPTRYAEGKEGQIGGETEAWIRYRFLMHYAEGSIMPLMVFSLLLYMIKTAPVPFFIKPITNAVAGKVEGGFLKPNFKTHLGFLEEQLATSEGDYLCGKEITAADILMSYPLEAATLRAGLTKDKYPKLAAYLDLLHEREAFKKANAKIKEVTGQDYDPNIFNA